MSRLIDADEFCMDIITGRIKETMYLSNMHKQLILNQINMRKTIDAVPVKHGHWIPTSEKMPKREEMVLVCFRWSGDEQFDIGYIDKDPDNLQLRWNFEDYDLCGDEMDDVVAWMPLPEPYKMDEVTE